MVSTSVRWFAVAALLGGATSVRAAANDLAWSEGSVARCIAKHGETSIKQGTVHKPLDVRDVLKQGDTVSTGKTGQARLLMRDGSVLDLAADTSMVLQAFKQEGDKPSVRLKTLLGRLWAHVMPRAEQDFVVEGSNAVAGVRGTSFVIAVNAQGQTTITTASGMVNVNGNGGSANVGPMHQLQVGQGKGPLTVTTITPQELQNLKNSMHIESSMDSGSGAKLVQNTQQQHSSNQPPPPPPPAPPPPPGTVLDRGVPTTAITTAPQLNIDPGARLTHVNATVQLRP